mgnify:CR=1 FL=1
MDDFDELKRDLYARLGSRFFDNPVLTISETAEIIRVSRKVAYRLAEQGNLPARRVGKQFRVLLPELIQWLKKEDEYGS